MLNDLLACPSCSCLFDLEYHITVQAGEPYVLCPRCGYVFHDIERCPQCGNAKEDREMTVENGEAGMVFVCSACGRRWSAEAPYAENYPPVKCAHCGREQDCSQLRSVGYREYFRCRCGEEWEPDEGPETCPRCGVNPGVEAPEFHTDTGSFVCKFCGLKFPSVNYWLEYWRI